MKCTPLRVSLWLLLLPVIATTNCDIVQPHDASAEQVDSVIAEPVGRYKSPVFNFLYPPGLTVQDIVQLESATFHWYPWRHMRVVTTAEGEEEEEECEVTNSLDDLPDDLFSRTHCRSVRWPCPVF